MTIYVKNILSTQYKDLIYNELKKSGVDFRLSRTEEKDTLEVIFPSGDEDQNYSLTKRYAAPKERKIKTLIQNIKEEILHLINFCPEPLVINLSVHLSEKFEYDYTYLATLFSSLEGITIERYVIAHRIQRVQDMLVTTDLSVTEIAMLMHYSSVSHLSCQFKKVTGVTTSQFKKQMA